MIYDRHSMDRSDHHAVLRALAAGKPRLNLATHRYRVLDGDELVGHFTNLRLVVDSIKNRPNAMVLDVAQPPRVLYRDGMWDGTTQ